jgi:hypothetical protein
LRRKLRRLIAKSWILSRCYYPLRGHRLSGRAKDEIWYFAYGANMHDPKSGSWSRMILASEVSVRLLRAGSGRL